MGKSKIEWTDYTWNPVTGCTKISEGCKNCYAERMAIRLSKIPGSGYPGENPFAVTLRPERLADPLRWRKPRKVFVCSQGDLFHENVPFEYIAQVFQRMDGPHIFIVLTKRPERMKVFFESTGNYEGWITHNGNPPDVYGGDGIIIGSEFNWPKKNIWIGVTAENQEMADKRIPILLQIPAAVRFVSIEPMLGPVDLSHYIMLDDTNGSREHFEKHGWGYDEWSGGFLEGDSCYDPHSGLNWVICGGESGSGARPMHPDWVRSLRDQCKQADVPFFFKQWGEWLPAFAGAPDVDCMKVYGRQVKKDFVLPINFPVCGTAGVTSYRVGKKEAGRQLDGKEYSEFPYITQLSSI